MKKIVLSILALTIVTMSSAQTKNATLTLVNPNQKVDKETVKKDDNNRYLKGNSFFCEDFSNGFEGNNPFGAWTIEDNLTENGDVLITGTEALFNTGTLESTTGANGYATMDVIGYILDNDLLVDNIGPATSAYITSPLLDMSELTSAVVSWEHYYYYCCANVFPLTLEVSIDNGINWELFDAGGPVPANVNVYSENGQEMAVDISELAAGEQFVKIRFAYNSELSPNYNDAFFAYFWAIDDVCITEKPANDVQISYSVVTQNPADFIEYGRVPLYQIDEGLSLSVNAYNFGTEEQTNVTLTASFTNGTTVINETASVAALAPEETIDIEIPLITDLTEGVYEGTFTLVSDQEVDGTEFSNNTNMRQFEITDGLYSQDGIGVYTNGNVSSIGPGSFLNPDDDDEPYEAGAFMTQYDLTDETTVTGVRVMLAGSNNAGAQIFSFMADTIDVLSDDLGNKLAESDLYTVTNADAAAGYVDLMFLQPIMLESNTYYAGVQVETGGAGFRLMDDQTVPQPGMASAIYLDQTYSNGIALGIRLFSTWIDAVDETSLNDFALSQNIPNPATNSTVVEYQLTKADQVTLEIVDATGKLIKTINRGKQSVGTHQITIDLQDMATGLYTYTLTVGETKLSKQMIKQ